MTITNPPDGSVFGNTDTINIGASSSGAGASVTNVQFFDGAALLGSVSAPPFNFIIGPFTFVLGTHTLTAVALDNLGSTGTSGPVHLTIARYTPEVTNGAFSVFLIPVATNMSAPLYGISPPGDTHRLFVWKNGLMRIIQDGVLLPTPALDLQPGPATARRGQRERRTRVARTGLSSWFQQPVQPRVSNAVHLQQREIPSNTLPTHPPVGWCGQ